MDDATQARDGLRGERFAEMSVTVSVNGTDLVDVNTADVFRSRADMIRWFEAIAQRVWRYMPRAAPPPVPRPRNVVDPDDFAERPGMVDSANTPDWMEQYRSAMQDSDGNSITHNLAEPSSTIGDGLHPTLTSYDLIHGRTPRPFMRP